MNGASGGEPRPVGSVVLIGPPGAGCTAVGRALADLWGVPVSDLAGTVARALGTRPELALVAVPETRYRSVEATTDRSRLSVSTSVVATAFWATRAVGSAAKRSVSAVMVSWSMAGFCVFTAPG